MPVSSVWMLEKSNITVSGGGSLDGVTQGDGSHLVGRTITLNSPSWLETFVNDNDLNFDDNDGNQTLSGAQTINGVTYANGTRVEAEYRITLRNPATGQTWQVIGYNVNNSNPAFGTIEGLAFIGPPAGWPPVGIALTVVAAAEGPGSSGQAGTGYDTYVNPPCFLPGTLILTPDGDRRIEDLRPGDLVETMDDGPQPVVDLLRTQVSASRLRAEPHLAPVRLAAHSLGAGLPHRDLTLSPRHCLLWECGSCELLFGSDQVLVAAKDHPLTRPVPLSYLRFGLTYLHLILERHQIIFAEGTPTETFRLGPSVYHGAPVWVQRRLSRLFPSAERGQECKWQQSARPLIRGWEAQLLAA
jgi:hypothetical protein